jgi:hypothetical protein
LRKFDIETYTQRRMRELNGHTADYTGNTLDPIVEEYTRRRMKELNVEEQLRQRKINLDKTTRLGYTVATMDVLTFSGE